MRKQTIERQFGTSKECHNFRYTNQKGIEKMTVKPAITFTCLNIKKLVKMLSQRDTNSPKKIKKEVKNIKNIKNIYQKQKIQIFLKNQISNQKIKPTKIYFHGFVFTLKATRKSSFYHAYNILILWSFSNEWRFKFCIFKFIVTCRFNVSTCISVSQYVISTTCNYVRFF